MLSKEEARKGRRMAPILTLLGIVSVPLLQDITFAAFAIPTSIGMLFVKGDDE